MLTRLQRIFSGKHKVVSPLLLPIVLLAGLIPVAKGEVSSTQSASVEVVYSGEVQQTQQVFPREARLFAVTLGVPNTVAWLPGAALMLKNESTLQQERQLQGALLFDLQQSSVPATNTLAAWLAEQPVTGRAQVATLDPDQLEVVSQYNLPLLSDAQVHYPARPNSVQVLTAAGSWLTVTFNPAVAVSDYLQSSVVADNRLDWLWVVQPNGTAKRIGIAAWNRYGYGNRYPWPGARIVPEYDWGLSEQFFADFARWLGSRVLP